MGYTEMHAAMLTRNSDDSGTDSQLVLIVNVDGEDKIQYTFPDTPQRDQDQGQANIYWFGVIEDTSLDPTYVAETYIRVGIRGDDMWRPEHFFVWGVAEGRFFITPLGMGVDLRTSGIQRDDGSATESSSVAKEIILSTDRSEGDLSFALPKVGLGGSNVPIRRLILLMTTLDSDDAGTDSSLRLQIATDGNLVVDYEVPDTPQVDQEQGQANWYFVPVSAPFTKQDLTEDDDDDLINLIIDGDDAWLPASLYLFGLDTESGQPTHVVPLVHLNWWNLGALSTDPTEGNPSVALPIVYPH